MFDQKAFEAGADIAAALPEEVFWKMHSGYGTYAATQLEIFAFSQEDIRAIRRICSKVRLWKKHYKEQLDWWEYSATYRGLEIGIFGCKEAPRACKKVDKVVMVKEMVGVEFVEQMAQVPIRFETREVERTIQVWECR